MPPDHARTAEALLSQSDWVRALVRGLGVDESGAEDVVQSTWLAALSKPPRSGAEGASFRAWIARVAHNFALRRIDGDARREGRERATAKEERLPSAADVVEREEARAEVVRALLDVHEPYRTALLLRFYEGLEPRDIARLQSVPASTVRNRLKRGLALLKERLETSHGPSWRQRCLLVLPAIQPKTVAVPQASYPAAAAASGGALVIKSLGIAATVALAAGGVYFTWQHSAPKGGSFAQSETARGSSSGFATGSAAAPDGATAKPRLSRAEAPLVAAAPGSVRTPAAGGTEAGAGGEAADDGIRCRVRGTLTQSDGSPIHQGTGALQLRTRLVQKEHEVALLEKVSAELSAKVGMSGHPVGIEASRIDSEGKTLEDKLRVEQLLAEKTALGLQDLKVSVEPYLSRCPHVLIASASGDAREVDVDGEGRFEFGGLKPDRWSLVATSTGFLSRRVEFEIRAHETEKQVDVALGPARALRVKMATPEGEDLVDAVTEALGDRFAPVPFATRTPQGARLEARITDARDWFGSARWRSRHDLDESTVGDASGVLELADAPPLHVGVAVAGIVLEQRLVEAGAEEVVFVVSLDRIRALVSGVAVQIVSARDGQPIAGASVRIEEFAGAVSGPDGKAEIRGIPPGLHEIRIHGEGTERGAEWVSVVAGETTDLGVRPLGPATTIRGRVVDEEGSPVKASVQLRSLESRSAVRELAICDSADTDAEGRFVIDVAGRRKYALTLDAGDRVAPLEIVDTTAGDVSDIVLRTAEAGEMRLTYPIEPPAGSLYVVVTSDGIPVAVRPADGWQPLNVRLGNGHYLARLVSNGGPIWTRHLVLEAGQMMAFDEKPARR